jgi:diaminopimelate decarboxylase
VSTEHALEVVARHFAISRGELRVGGVHVSELAGRFGTPLFVYDRAVLDAQWSLLRSTYPPEFSICYSVKANPNPAILRHFLDKGAGLEIASAGEFHQARAAGCPPDRLLFAGPGKTEAELELVLGQGIGEIHAESVTEIERLARIAGRLDVTAAVALRVNPTSEAEGGALRMGGKPTPFGIDEEVAEEVLDRVLASPRLEFRGVHLFAGTQILDAAVLIRQYRKGLEIARRLARRAGRPLATVDFGGGLGVPYFAADHALDTTKLREGLAGLMADVADEPLLAGTRLLIEPGRFLAAPAGVYVTRVTDVKVSRGKKFVVLDGGMNHHLAASGNLGQVIRRNFPVAVLNRLDDTRREVVDVVGPLCTPLDTLARDLSSAPAEVGDLVGVFQSGAYARSASPLNFLSHPSPPEVMVDGARCALVRRRGTLAEMLADIPDEGGR